MDLAAARLTSVGEKKALQLLGTAFDAGVRHFDVARYYGYGESEGILGTFAKSRRAEVTITTKFGIEPPRRTNVLRFAMQAGRRLVQFVPAARGFLRRRAQGLVKSGAFSVKDAQTSLETSLRELGTDYIDFFLLHEYAVSENPPDELVAFLTDAAKAGKIRYFGLGTGIENCLAGPGMPAGTLQRSCNLRTACSIGMWKDFPEAGHIGSRSRLDRSARVIIRFQPSSKLIAKSARNWSAKLAVDCSKDETISALMLNYSVQANPNGLVLFSSKDASRVSRNVRAVLEPELSPAQVELFGQLVERDLMPTIQSA